MTRVSLFHRLFSIAVLMPAGQLFAQQTAPTIAFKVYTEPPGAKFSVDGVIYTTAANFQWPQGSTHSVRYVQDTLPPTATSAPDAPTLSTVQLSPDGGTAYGFVRWSDSNGLTAAGNDPNQTVTASASVTSLKATVTVNYRILLNFFDRTPATLPPTCGSPGSAPSGELRVGVVYVGTQCYWNNAILYQPAGSQLTLNAYPFPGFAFLGWSSNLAASAYLTSFVLSGPITIAPMFTVAKRVRFETNPYGLQVLVDRTPTPTIAANSPSPNCPANPGIPVTVQATVPALCGGDFDFAPGSVHLVGAASPQTDQFGKSWVFDSWGDGNGQNAPYTADNQTANSDLVMVKFLPGAQASFVTSPQGLKLSVDGRTNWPGYNFVWGLGTAHQVSAPAAQTDAAGRKYTFRSWSNGGEASQTVTMDRTAVDSGFRIVASFDVLSRLTVQSNPPGLKIQVDGADCVTPCVADRAAGSQVRVTAPTSVSLGDGARLDLSGWTDGGPADHAYTLASDTQTVTASYTASYRLLGSSDPANGAAFQFTPASPDSFYPVNTPVTVEADAKPGFKFRRWAGDLNGTYFIGSVEVSAPKSVTALLDRTPYVAPAGIQNAAGPTPDSVVAPGSLIEIQGESLASDTVMGRTNPLAQTLAGVTVTIGDALLPLVSVSPQSIVAQIPSTLPEGSATLQVHSAGQPDVSGDFTVARNAPGLFNALHSDGSAVTAASPLQAGETITLVGTGFGPYLTRVIDGFFPGNPPPATADPVDILIGDQTVTSAAAKALAGDTGKVSAQAAVPQNLPTASSIGVQVRVNGRVSNTLTLPTQ